MTALVPTGLITRFHSKMLEFDYTNKRVSLELHVQNSHVSEWKRGMRPIPTHHLITLCKMWHCKPRDLVGWVPQESP